MAPKEDSSAADLSNYCQERLHELRNKLKTVTDKRQRENIEFAIKAYEKGNTPGGEGMYTLIFIQKGKVCDLQKLDLSSPYLREVSTTEIIVLFCFAK
jgi:hypothetical protein